MDEDVSTKKFLVGLAGTMVTGAFMGVAVATDVSRTSLILGWAAVFVALYFFNSRKAD